MTPDQLIQLAVGAMGLGAAVFGNNHMRAKDTDRKIAAESDVATQLKTESALLRESLDRAADKMVRLEVRIEAGEAVNEQVSRDIQQLRSEMHSLSGKVEAADATNTEVLQQIKAAKEKAAKLEEHTLQGSGGLVKVKEEGKKHGR